MKRKAENHDSEGSHFKKTTKKVQVILESFGSHNGVGDKLHELLPNHLDSADAVAAFLLFVHERQKIWKRKYTGKRQTLTKNNVLSTQWFTNMYRELDRGTMYLRKCLLQDELKDRAPSNTIDQELVHSVLFKSVVYRLINKVETFMDFGGLPTPKDFTTFLKFLAEKKSQNEVIFTCAHQNMGYERLLKTLHFARKNSASLASQVIKAAENKSLKMAHKTLLSIPNVGAFFAWQILCDLLETRVLGKNTDNQWTCLGPGAKNGLRRIFPLETTKGELRYTRMLRDICSTTGPNSGFAALGLAFPSFLEKPLSLKNVEHALCEYDKYFRLATGIQVRDRAYKSRSWKGEDSCDICRKSSDLTNETRISCSLCGTVFHKNCKKDWRDRCHTEGSYLCSSCWKWEAAWCREDFAFEEQDDDDEIERAVVYRPSKKKSKQEKKQREIECIDLSSDEEAEEDDSLVEIVDDGWFGETEVAEVDGDPLAGTLEVGSDEPLAFNVIYI